MEEDKKICDICKTEIDPKKDFVIFSMSEKLTYVHYNCLVEESQSAIKIGITEAMEQVMSDPENYEN